MRIRFFVIICIFVLSCPVYGVGICDKYLGTKYISDPLGEATEPDLDPLMRFDAFDCVTFVETCLSNGDLQKLNKIRYHDGKIDFLHRNHFVESDWIENNSSIIKNVSSKYAATDIRNITIDKQNWLIKTHNTQTKIPKKDVKLEYIPYNNIQSIKNKNDLIVLFIVGKSKNSDIIGTDLAVVHMGFLLSGGKTLRHASSAFGYVMDTDFLNYVSERQKNKNNIGIVLLEIKNDK